MSDDWDFHWLQEVIEDASKSRHLTAWEEKFVADMGERIHRYGASVMVSQAQIDVIRKIEGKIYGT